MLDFPHLSSYNIVMIKREVYLERLRQLRDTHIIKTVTGIRRCGKSTLLEQFQQELLAQGVRPDHILVYNLEDSLNRPFTEQRDLLHNHIIKQCDQTSQYYIFIDEVQLIPEFERTIDSLFLRKNLDLYITGSNAYMTSGELATFLSGRYIEIKMQPLTFSEFVQFFPDDNNTTARLQDFVRFGGFPEVANLLARGVTGQIPQYLRNIYETVLEKDIKTNRRIRDLEDFRNLVEFMFDNIGNITSPSKIANALTSSSNKTVDDYLSALANCYVLYEAERFDIRGKQLLQTLSKYYAIDLGLADAVLGKSSDADQGRRLENIVYLELLHRYGQVWVGKNYDKEIDFVVRDADGMSKYFQVTQTATGQTLERELAPLKNTGDNYPKTVLTLDLLETDEDGIERRNLINWLLEKPS